MRSLIDISMMCKTAGPKHRVKSASITPLFCGWLCWLYGGYDNALFHLFHGSEKLTSISGLRHDVKSTMALQEGAQACPQYGMFISHDKVTHSICSVTRGIRSTGILLPFSSARPFLRAHAASSLGR
jgi:hypothetical protein